MYMSLLLWLHPSFYLYPVIYMFLSNASFFAPIPAAPGHLPTLIDIPPLMYLQPTEDSCFFLLTLTLLSKLCYFRRYCANFFPRYILP